MSGPVALASGVLGAVGSVAGGQTSAAGARFAGQSQANAYEFNAKVQDENARLAPLVASANAQESDYLTRQIEGTQRSAFGAAGVDTSTGSPLDVMGDTASQAKLRALSIIYGGDQQSAAAKNQAIADRASAEAARRGGEITANAAESAGAFGATSSLLGGVVKAIPFLNF